MNRERLRPRLATGEEFFVNRAAGFSVVRPAGWRVASEAEVRASLDPRNWRRTELVASMALDTLPLPPLCLTAGQVGSPEVADAALVQHGHEPDASFTPVRHLEELLGVLSEIVYFDLQVRTARTPFEYQGRPAARMETSYTHLPVDAPPVLCVRHDLSVRRGADIISFMCVRVVGHDRPAPSPEIRRVWGSFRILD